MSHPTGRLVFVAKTTLGVRSPDTSQTADTALFAQVSQMSIQDRALKSAELSEMCTTLAIAGISAQHGEISSEDLRWHLCARRYSQQLADAAYGSRR